MTERPTVPPSATSRLRGLVEAELERRNITAAEAAREARLPAGVQRPQHREATDRWASAAHRRVEGPDPDHGLEKPAKPDLNRLQIQESPTETALLRRIAGRTAFAGVEKRPLPLYPVNPVDTGEKGSVSSTEASDVRHEIVSDQDAERRRPQRPVLPESGGKTRERGQPALAAGDQLSGGGLGRDDIATGRTTPTLGRGRGPGQPHIARQGDARADEVQQSQREPPEPRGTAEVRVAQLAGEEVRGIGTCGADAVDRYRTHGQPPR